MDLQEQYNKAVADLVEIVKRHFNIRTLILKENEYLSFLNHVYKTKWK